MSIRTVPFWPYRPLLAMWFRRVILYFCMYICPIIKVNDMRVCIAMKTRRKKIMSIVFMFVMFGIVPLTNIYAIDVHC